MLLKDIPGVMPVLFDSPFASSSLWEKDVSSILPVQIEAVKKQALINGYKDAEIDTICLVRQIQLATTAGLCESKLSNYNALSDRYILATEFASGLEKMEEPYRRATLFGLEMKLSAIRVSQLTVGQAHTIPQMTKLAKFALRSSIASIQTVYQFWTDKNGSHEPLDDIHEVIYGAFGMTWMELSARYRNMIADY